MTPAPASRTAGLLQAIAAYGLWGILPIYLWLARPTGVLELISWRVLFSIVFCLAVIAVMRSWAKLTAILRNPRTVGLLAVAGVLIMVNWLLYVWAVELGRPLEGALGYYLNPLFSILLGMLVLGERLRPLQWVAVGLAVAAVGVMIVGYGQAPWLSLGLAITFAVYGLVKKQVSGHVDPVAGFTVETVAIAPIAFVLLVLVGSGAGLTFGTVSVGHTVVLLFAGVITSLPLLLFATSARTLTLTELGLVQYLAPTIQFVVGLLLFDEQMPPERWLGFGLVWLALILFTVDQVRAARSLSARSRIERSA